MRHLERMTEYLLSTEKKVAVVFLDTSIPSLMIDVAEKAANFKIDSVDSLAEKVALVKEHEDVINRRIQFEDGTSKFFCIPDSKNTQALKGSILHQVQVEKCKVVVFENDRLRERRMSYEEQVGWNEFKQVLKRGLGVEIVFFEEVYK